MKAISIWFIAAIFVGAGVMHFVKPKLFAAIVPPFLPNALLLVYLSGVAEILGGLGVLVPAFRAWAGWGLIALLVAVFPANVYMALEAEKFGIAPVWLWLRLPLQLVLIAWVWWATKAG
ncbi:MAG: hypothetical protein ABJF88_02425 [Rhodothermales bacterium]